MDLQTWRSCWERISVLADDARPHGADAYDYIRRLVVDHCPAVAADSRLAPAIRFVMQR